MFKNPIINAIYTSGYILLVVSVMTYITQPLRDKPDTFFAPVVFLSVLTLSVSVMAFLFFYQPTQLFIDNKKREAVNHFGKTVGAFAVITAVALTLLYLGIF